MVGEVEFWKDPLAGAEDQMEEVALPPKLPASVVEVPSQIATEGPAETVAGGKTLTRTVSRETHAAASVT